MRKLLRKFLGAKKAATAIEFALVAPVFFLLLLGIIEFGLTMYFDGLLNVAVRDVARQGTVKPYQDIGAVREVMRKFMGGYVDDTSKLKVAVYVYDDVVQKTAIIEPDGTTRNLYRANPEISNFTLNPELMFAAPAINNRRSIACTGTNCQSNAMVIYAAKLEWGGFTKLISVFLPANLYSTTVTKNEPY